MSIEQNVEERKQAKRLFSSMLDVTRDDFQKLPQRSKILFLELAFDHFHNLHSRFCVPNMKLAREKIEEPNPEAYVSKLVSEALQDLEELIELYDEIPLAGIEFSESVKEHAKSMYETISATKRVTTPQLKAIENWRTGVGRWIS